MMDFDKAVEKYLALRKECEAIEAESKRQCADRKKVMADIEAWITAKAQEEGLKTVPTLHGTAYWSTHHSCRVANRESFFQFVKENDAWDLLESRASKLAVKSYIDGSGEAPPGVDFSSIRVMNVKSTSATKEN